MSQKTFHISTLSDRKSDFEKLFLIANEINLPFDSFYFDFSNCDALWPNTVALLGGIARLAESKGKQVEFGWESLKNKPRAILCQNGFAHTFGHSLPTPVQDAIPYREDRSMNMNSIMDYLTDFWIGKGWVHVSKELRDAIAGKMWEIYSNAFEHGDGKFGVFTCGEHLEKDLVLTVVDFGKGIPDKVRYFLRSDPRAEKLESSSCLKWAFQRGNSTCLEGVARGLGLDLLKEFIQMNQGKLEVYSNDGYVIIDHKGMKYENLDISFEGTVVHITLRCDEKLYHFKHEINPKF